MSIIDRDPDETVDINVLIAQVFDRPDEWLDRPHALLAGYKPRELIATNHEAQLRNLLRSIKLGMFS